MIKEQKHILQRKVFETTPGKTIWLSLVKDRNVNVLGLDSSLWRGRFNSLCYSTRVEPKNKQGDVTTVFENKVQSPIGRFSTLSNVPPHSFLSNAT